LELSDKMAGCLMIWVSTYEWLGIAKARKYFLAALCSYLSVHTALFIQKAINLITDIYILFGFLPET
jgi:hypothetical protein